jgi:two-component system, LytTR family, response regulator
MKYKCLIVDDEELARELMLTHLAQFDNFELVASCSSAIEAYSFLQQEHIDLIFLDIEMPGLKGNDFIKSLDRQPQVIFTTAHRHYALEGYELNVIDYLLKPIVFARFFKAIEKFTQSMGRGETSHDLVDYIFVQYQRKNVKVILSDILYVESLKDQVKIHFKDDSITFKSGLSAFEEKLDTNFLRVHRSFIVNLNRITAFTKKDIEIGGNEIPIGEFYKEAVFQKLG